MGQFVYQAKTLDGRVLKGEVEAATEAEVRIKLRAQKLVPVRIATKNQSAAKNQSGFRAVARVSPKELQIFTRQFAVLVGSGVPIMQSLEAMVAGGRSPAMATALRGVLESVSRGRPLAESMAQYPAVFDRLYVNLIRAGEESGVLDTILNRLAEYIEKSVKLKGKVKGALFYPVAIIVVAFGVIAGIMIFVIPKFVSMFKSSGQELPALTQFVVDASDFFADYWYVVLGAPVVAFFAFRTYYESEDGRKVLDRVFIEVPLFGSLIQKASIARVSRTLGTLLAAGVRIMDAIEITASVAGNWVIEKSLMDARDVVSRGRTFAEPLAKIRYFPTMVTQMISIGEQTGNMDAMLNKVADFYEDEVETATDALTSMIEPLLMVFLGGVIALIVVALYLPIFNMAGTVSG